MELYMEPAQYMEDAHNEELYSTPATPYEYEQQNDIQEKMQDEGLQEESQEQQLENTVDDVEMSEEKLTETSLGKLKYQEAEAIFRAESKQIIFTQETEKTTFSILGEQKCDFLELIKDQQKLIEELDMDNESLDRRVQYSNAEITSLHQRIVGNEVIVNKLKDFVKSMKTNFESLQQRNQKYLEKAEDQRKKTEDLQNSALSRINSIKKDIKIRNETTGKNDTKKLEKENLILKLQIAECKEHLKKLLHQREEIESKSEYIMSLKERKKSLEDNMREKASTLEKLKGDVIKSEAEWKKAIEMLDRQTEEKKINLADLQSQISDKNNETEVYIKENEDLKNDLDKKLENSSIIKQKLLELAENLKTKSLKVDLASEKFEELVNTHKATLEPLEKEECLLKDENYNLKTTVETKMKEYTNKLEEKNETIMAKFALDEKVNKEKQLMMSIKQLDEQISVKKQKTELLQSEIQKIIEDTHVQVMIKNKAYLISSQEYLSEKLNNLRSQLDGVKSSWKTTDEHKSNFEIQIEERQKTIKDLEKQLEDIENSLISHSARAEPPTGILKTTLSTKQNPISPKKVKFVDVSSYESSSLSGEVAHEKTFDQLLENFQKFKKPVLSAKQRTLNLD